MKDIDKGSLKENVSGGWVAWLQHYFVTARIPAKSDNNVVQTRKDSRGNYIIGYTGPAISVPAGGKVETSAMLYAGPKIQSKLKELSPARTDRRLRLPVVHCPADLLAAATYPQPAG